MNESFEIKKNEGIMKQGFVVFGGRHLLHTRYQETFLKSVMGRCTGDIEDMLVGDGALPQFSLQQVVFAV